MTLLAGTRNGVYRGDPDALEDAVRTLDSDRVMRVRTFGGRAYAATRSGLYRSTDGGDAWRHLPTPRQEVYSVLEHPVDDRLYVGTHPAHLYLSTDGGDTWSECTGLQDLPSRDDWHTPRHRNEAHVRALRAAGPDRIVAGIEVGGVHLSDDAGATWTECRDGVHDDVHHVLATEDYWIASTGDGLYRTADDGRTWRRLDDDVDHRYFREAHVHDGRLYAAASRGPPPTWDGGSGTDAALFESTDDGATLRRVEYPGGPGEFVLSFAAVDGDVHAGTTAGRLLRRDEDGWTTVGHVPSSVPSITVVE